MMSQTKSGSTLKEYVQEQMSWAKERGCKTCTLFAKDEIVFEALLTEMQLRYITPRVGCYIVSVE